MELREYQQRSIDQLYDWFRHNQGNPCLNLPTGSGKSIIIASLCQDALTNWPETKIILLTHVKELIEQDTRQILNVWPDAPVGIYSASVGVKKLGYPITVAGIQSIRHKAKKVGHIDLCIVDECFISGTLIKTPHGDIPIERLRPGDKVFNALGVGKIEAISQKETTNLIRLEFDDGTITSCTENHPFFTSNGWKKAGELENGTHILSFKEMRILWKSFYSVDKKRRGREIYLRNARKTLGKTKILFNFLCEKSRKPHERQTKQREDETNTSANTAQAHSKGRKWETASIASACAASCTWGRLGCGICCEHRGQEQVSPLCLQNRHSKSCAKNSDRGRRTVTQHNGAKGAGHKENKPFNFVRVVSVSRVKCESPCAVFNLQVSGHPSYFADEHLVHNCHLISHKAEGSYRTFIDDLRAINPNLRVIGLTATPYRLGHGLITDKPAIFDDILEPTSIEELLAHGYLAPLRSKRPDNLLSTDGVAKRGGEFIEAELQKAVNKKDQNLRVACEIVRYAEERKAWLIFCTGVKHAHAMAEILKNLDIPTACITGETPKNEREAIVEGFKTGRLRALTNANCLCLDEETEILTSDGFIGIDEMTPNHLIAAWKEDGSIEFTTPKTIVRRERGLNEQMVCFGGGMAANIRVTSNHRMVVRCGSKRSHIKVVSAQELVGKSFTIPAYGESEPLPIECEQRKIKSSFSKQVIATAYNYRKKGIDAKEARIKAEHFVTRIRSMRYKNPNELSLEECMFIGFWLGDGTKSCGRYSISQSLVYEDNIIWAEDIFNKIGLHFTKKIYPQKVNMTSPSVRWSFSRGTGGDRQSLDGGYYRYEPYLEKGANKLLLGLDKEQLLAVLEGLWRADGVHHGIASQKTHYITSVFWPLINTLQAACSMRGISAVISKLTLPKKKNHQQQYRFSWGGRQNWGYVKDSTHSETVYKQERVWCVTSSTSFLICRRRGHVFVTGNTTGFDYPDIDLIALCRPTMSPGLYMQTVGRGMRIAPDKTDCLVLDFAGNVKRHGPITAVRPPDRKGQGHGEAPVKVCEQCQEFVTLSTRVCPVCGWEFPAPEVKPLRLHNDDIMGNGKTMRVKSWLWRVYTSNSGKEMVTITYFSADNLAEMVTEYLCLLHGGYAQDKAQRLLYGIAKRAGAVIENPYDLEGIVSTMNTVPAPVEITKERDGKYYRVTGRSWNHAA